MKKEAKSVAIKELMRKARPQAEEVYEDDLVNFSFQISRKLKDFYLLEVQKKKRHLKHKSVAAICKAALKETLGEPPIK